MDDALLTRLRSVDTPTVCNTIEAAQSTRGLNGSTRGTKYNAMAEGPKPSVAVVEDIDFPDCVGAYRGEVNTEVHKGFGMSGAPTNGVMRDLGDMAAGFPVIARSVGPSHGFVHVTGIDVPVTVFGKAPM